VTCAEAAKILGIGRSQISVLIQKGVLRAVRVGRRLDVDPASVENAKTRKTVGLPRPAAARKPSVRRPGGSKVPPPIARSVAVDAGRPVARGWLDVATAAEMLDLDAPAVVALIEDGDLPAVRWGPHWRLRIADIEAFRATAAWRDRWTVEAEPQMNVKIEAGFAESARPRTAVVQ
jgi:excisionase family DNA binding protein